MAATVMVVVATVMVETAMVVVETAMEEEAMAGAVEVGRLPPKVAVMVMEVAAMATRPVGAAAVSPPALRHYTAAP